MAIYNSTTYKNPKKINFGLHENSCNLSCPKCLVHSKNYKRGVEIKKTLGVMTIEDIVKVFEEVKAYRPMVSPSFWSEPLLNRKLFTMFSVEAKKRNLPIMINTNGLLIDQKMAEFLIDNLTTVSVSIDATTKETLQKVRSTDELKKINNVVDLLLKLRGDKKSPRIVVSFTEEDDNLHERDQFVDYWLKRADAIRINKAYSDERTISKKNYIERVPCREIYDSLTIDFDGTARFCCLDGYRETNLGNVFRDGVHNVWNGKMFNKLRLGHEGKGEKIHPFCEGCDQWAGFNIIKEYQDGELLIRETQYSTYLNRLDRMSNWDTATRRGD